MKNKFIKKENDYEIRILKEESDVKKYLKVWMGEDDNGYLEKKYEIVWDNYQYLAYNYSTSVYEEYYELTELDTEKLKEHHKKIKQEEKEREKAIEIQRLEKKIADSIRELEELKVKKGETNES